MIRDDPYSLPETTNEARVEANSLQFLQEVYRSPSVGLHIRMRAAMACLPF